MGKVPKDLKQKLKKLKGAKTLLQALEEDIRAFVQEWEDTRVKSNKEEFGDIESDEEEIVFVGRSGDMDDMRDPRVSEEELARDKLVFDSMADDNGAGFGYAIFFLLLKVLLNALDGGSSTQSDNTMAYGLGRSR